MAIFKKRQPGESLTPSAWAPLVDLSSARPVVFALAGTPVSSDVQVRAAIEYFVRLSDRPPLDSAIHLIRTDPNVLHRLWIWLGCGHARSRCRW